jgi:hypothetical protein
MTLEEHHAAKRSELENAVLRALTLADELGLSDVGIQLDGALTRLTAIKPTVSYESRATH